MTDAQRLFAAGRSACSSCVWRGEDLVGLCRYHREILHTAQAEHVEKLTRLQRWRQRMAEQLRARAAPKPPEPTTSYVAARYDAEGVMHLTAEETNADQLVIYGA